MAPLLVLAPIEPCATGNGLAMRLANFIQGASLVSDVRVAVIPVAGHLQRCPEGVAVPVVTVPPPERPVLQRDFAKLLADPAWRRLLSDANPMPPLARMASPALASEVIRESRATPGTPVHVFRSYLAPLGLAIADKLHSPWASLDLDDDDEGLSAAQGDPSSASDYHRLVANFAPRYSAICMASPDEAVAVGDRHHLEISVVCNAVRLPVVGPPRRPDPNGLLFVANLGYRPNVDAAVLLVEQVLPVMQSRTGRAVRVVLVGEYPPSGRISALAADRSVTLTGFVDDVTPFYAEASVMVAPIITGSGTRIKLLEAFAHHVPVISTPAGASGLKVQDGEHLLVAESVDDLAVATEAVLNDRALADKLTGAAFEFVRQHHGPVIVAEQVASFLDSARAAGRVS
jgi:polysaccharide biosynthesis protein PslH